jgi:DNA polymerase elongation subunit (family B)
LKEYYQDQNNKPFAGIAKMFINSLYGKFGQLGLSMTKIGSCDPRETMKMHVVNIDHNEYYSITKIGGSVIREEKRGEGYNSFPAIAAHVTAYARIYLNQLRKLIPAHNVFYMDTDSLIVDNLGLRHLDHLMHPTHPGKLKVELSSKWLIVNAPKDYRMENRTRTKGIRADAELIAPNAFLQDQWTRIPGLIQDGNVDQFYTHKIIKRLARSIHSGVVQKSGWVIPFRLTSGGLE